MQKIKSQESDIAA